MMNFWVVAAGLVGQNMWGEKEHLVTTDKLLLMSLNVGSTNQIGEQLTITFTFHVGHIISTYLFKQEQEQIGEQDVLNSHKQTAQKHLTDHWCHSTAVQIL